MEHSVIYVDVMFRRLRRPPLYTIHSLNNDVLYKIFTHHDRRDPWVLSHVCQRWRALSVTSPLLWNTIVCDVRRPPHLLGLKTMLERSGNVAMVVAIVDGPWTNDTSAKEVRASVLRNLLPLLMTSTARWTRLFVHAPSDIYEMLSKCPFDRLRTMMPHLSKRKMIGSTTLSLRAPNLIELVVEDSMIVDLPLSRGIESFMTPSFGLKYLPTMPNLQKLQITGQKSRWDFLRGISNLGRSTPFFVLPALRTISINEAAKPTLHELSKRFDAPALETLELSVRHRTSSPSHHPRLPIFTVGHLINLSIDYEGCSPNDTVTFLSRAPSITNLYLGRFVATPEVTKALGAGVLPNLKNLYLPVYKLKVAAEDVIEMLEARICQGKAAIPAVSFTRVGPNEYVFIVSSKWDDFVEAYVHRQDLLERWAVLRESIDIRFIPKHSFFDED